MTDYTLHLGDALQIMATLPDGSINAVCADLPFGSTKNSWDTVIPLADLWTQFARLVKPHGAIVLFGTQPFSSELVASNRRGYKHKWVWCKRQAGNFAVAKYMPLTVDEDILVFTAKGERVNYYPQMRTGKLRTKGGKASAKNGRGFGGLKNISYQSDQYYPTSLLTFASVPRTQRLHASQKPTELLKYLLATYTRPGDVVLDCTCGVASTGVACVETGRGFVGIELDAGYHSMGAQLLERAKQEVGA